MLKGYLSPELQQAILACDTKKLSAFGKKGAEAKRNKKKRKDLLRLRGATEMAFEANEYICPVD